MLKSTDLDSGEVSVGAARTTVLTLPVDAASRLTHSITYDADLTAGVTKGETLGTITYTLDGKTLATIPAVALADSPAAGMLTRLSRAVSKML